MHSALANEPMNNEPQLQEDPQQSRPKWTSYIGMAIFLLFVLGRPLAGLVRQVLNNSFSLGNIAIPWQSLIPLGAGLAALVVGALVIGRVLGVGESRTPPPALPPAQYDPTLPQAPQFEPLVNPWLLAIGIFGLLVIGAGFVFLLFGI